MRDGEVYWLTLMAEDIDNSPPDAELAERWEAEFPSEHIPILTDETQLSMDYAGLQFWPTLILLEPDLIRHLDSKARAALSQPSQVALEQSWTAVANRDGLEQPVTVL